MGVIERFYRAFQQRDAVAMGHCYRADARFSDPAFPDLDAAQVRAMWSMLLSGSNDLRMEFEVLEENDTHGRVRWEAWYTFSRTGRPVHNIIHSTFELRNGLILRQRDRFDFWRWSRQALGLIGWLLGWTPFLRSKVQGVAKAALAKAMRS